MDNNEETSYNDNEKKSVMLFGRDISKVPCFRNTYLYGLGGGIVVGLTSFMFTSRPQLSTHLAVASFTIICLSYWTQCRYKYSKARFELAQLRAGMQQHVMFEGTQIEKEVEAGNAKDI